MEYLDFDLEILSGTGRDYPVAVLRSPAGEARATMHFPFDQLALESRLDKLQIALLRSGGKRRSRPLPEEQAVQDLGVALFDALFTGEIRSRYDVSCERAAQGQQGLRLKLRIQDPKLAALPWEFLYDSQQAEYVCLSRNTPMVRYLELPQRIQSLAVTPPLRILGMIASPCDLAPLDVAREKARMDQAVASLCARGLVEVTWLEGQTWRDLQREMQGGPWHIFHFVGHGGFDDDKDEGFVCLTGEDGRARPLGAPQLGRLLADHRSLRLVLLNACEGARGSGRDVFSSTASILVRRGIPAVLAMQYDITDGAAIEFTRVFYETLARGLPLDAAVTEARKAVSITITNTLEWGVPLLYMRAADAVLFDFGAGFSELSPTTIVRVNARTFEHQAASTQLTSSESLPGMQGSQAGTKVAPKAGKSVAKWSGRDEAFLDGEQGIREAAQGFYSDTSGDAPRESCLKEPSTGATTRKQQLYPPMQLPSTNFQFVDRERILERLAAAAQLRAVIGIYGLPGVGKTALANELAWRLYRSDETRFPDGIIWSDLQIGQSPEGVLRHILVTYGCDISYQDVWQTAQTLLSRKRALWVLDGADHLTQRGAVTALLAVRGSCTVLVTSRDSEVMESYKQELLLLSPKDSLKLFQVVSGRGEGKERSCARKMCVRLGHLPLAIRIAASWAGSRACRHKSLASLLETLEAISPLDLLKSPIPMQYAKDQEVRASFELSWQDLESDRIRHAFAANGVFAGEDWDAESVAALLGEGQAEVADMLDQLTNKCLLERGRTESRYSAHPLLREFAREKLGQNSELFWLIGEHYRSLVSREYQRLHGPDAVGASQRLTLELGNLQGVWRFLREKSEERAIGLIKDLLANLWEFMVTRGYFEHAQDLLSCAEILATRFNEESVMVEVSYARASVAMVQRSADDAAQQLCAVAEAYRKLTNRKRLCDVWIDLACLYTGTGSLVEAQRVADESLDLARSIGAREQGEAHWVLGNLCSERGLISEAITHFHEAIELLQSCGDVSLMGLVQLGIGSQYRIQGQPEVALSYFESALQLFSNTQHVINTNYTLWEIGNAYLQLGRVVQAEQHYSSALENARRTMNRWIMGAAMCGLAEVGLERGQLDTAVHWYQQAMLCAEELGVPHRSSIALQGLGEAFLLKDRLGTALQYLREASQLRQSKVAKEEYLFAVAYLLTERHPVRIDQIGDIVKVLVANSRDRAVLLVTIAHLAREQHPEWVMVIGDLLRDIGDSIQQLDLGDSFDAELHRIETVGELLAQLMQRTLDLPNTGSAKLQEALRKAGYWPQSSELRGAARYVRTKTSGGGGGCFPAGTAVLVPGRGARAIETLKVDDPIWSTDASRNLVEGRIKAVYWGIAESYFLINGFLRVTGTHTVYTSRGWMLAEQVEPGLDIYDQEGHPILLERKEHIRDMLYVYNIDVEPEHTFFAEGILVHNPKSRKDWM